MVTPCLVASCLVASCLVARAAPPHVGEVATSPSSPAPYADATVALSPPVLPSPSGPEGRGSPPAESGSRMGTTPPGERCAGGGGTHSCSERRATGRSLRSRLPVALAAPPFARGCSAASAVAAVAETAVLPALVLSPLVLLPAPSPLTSEVLPPAAPPLSFASPPPLATARSAAEGAAAGAAGVGV